MPKSGETDRFSFGEHTVLLSITVISLVSSLATSMVTNQLFHYDTKFFAFAHGMAPLLGVVLFPFLSEINGRRPVFILLAALSTLTSILQTISSVNKALLLIKFSTQTMLSGGTQTLIYLAVSEYCNPRHRFAYLVANRASSFTGQSVISVLSNFKLLDPASVYVVSFMIAAGVACVACACAWPESPYWLAARGRGADAARALRRLRGGDAAPEIHQLEQYRRTPGPRSLFWKPLLFAIILMTVSVINYLQNIAIFFSFPGFAPNIFGNYALSLLVENCIVIVAFAVITVISYCVQRKALFLGGCAITLAVSFAFGIWRSVGDTENDTAFSVFVFICNILRDSGISLSLLLAIEIIPYKYNTHMWCICILYHFVMVGVGMLLFGVVDVPSHAHIVVLVIATLSVPGVGLVFWLAPETGGKSLFEIQKSYAPRKSECNEQNETMLEDIRS